jgi:Universal stress protein family
VLAFTRQLRDHRAAAGLLPQPFEYQCRPGPADRNLERGIIGYCAQHHGLGREPARPRGKAEVERIVSTEIDVASTILSHAADTSADLLVIGGYGHSRLREFILGGVTRGILAAMTVPTLMSH